MKLFKTFVLSLCMVCLFTGTALCATLGPAADYAELLDLAAQAAEGDLILITGRITADAKRPLSTSASLRIASSKGEDAALLGLQLDNASVSFSGVSFEESLSIRGTSYIELGSGVSVQGAKGESALSFDGNGMLIVYPDCTVQGGDEGGGMMIRHRGGDFYAGIEGTISGGSGVTGGSGLTVSPLKDTGTLMISGRVSGGSGASHGGQALNLYELSDNAFITVTGKLQGGDGAVGGDGIQLVSTNGNASVGIHGEITGGSGRDYGGDALILMNMSGASSVSLSGSLTGGDVTGSGAQPGTSLLVVGSGSASRTHVGECHLQDGRDLAALNVTPTPEPTQEPSVTPLPEITSSVDDAAALITPSPTPAPEETPAATQAPTESSSPEIVLTPTPSPSPTAEPALTEQPLPSVSPEQSAVPDAASSPVPTASSAV